MTCTNMTNRYRHDDHIMMMAIKKNRRGIKTIEHTHSQYRTENYFITKCQRWKKKSKQINIDWGRKKQQKQNIYFSDMLFKLCFWHFDFDFFWVLYLFFRFVSSVWYFFLMCSWRTHFWFSSDLIWIYFVETWLYAYCVLYVLLYGILYRWKR